MSVTTTSNPLTYASAAVLRDYELAHSEADEPLDASLNAHPAPSSQTSNPPDWDTEHRRVPAYRPINTELDQSERRVYQNPIERAFITTMFTGVFLEAVSLWNTLELQSQANVTTDGFQNLASNRWQGLECRL
jgi:hypothetical protein